jgi:hypothetical protein
MGLLSLFLFGDQGKKYLAKLIQHTLEKLASWQKTDSFENLLDQLLDNMQRLVSACPVYEPAIPSRSCCSVVISVLLSVSGR